MDKSNIIDFTKYLPTSDDENNARAQAGIDALNALSPDQAHATVEFIMNYVLTEVKVGLGILDLPADAQNTELKIFNKIADIYEEAAGGCYFCSEGVDPNEDEYGPHTQVCLMCKLKLANYTEALGIPAEKVFKGLKARAQKSRLKIDGD